MAKVKNNPHLSYLYLSILAFLAGISMEVLSGEYAIFTLPEMTLNLVISTIYVLAAALMLAFISTVKLANEQKYILYLVVLAITFFRVMALVKGLI